MLLRKVVMVAYRGLQITFVALIVTDLWWDFPYPWWGNFLPLVLSLVLLVAFHQADRPRRREIAARGPVEVAPPVSGRWSALNSPASRTPSHGTHAYGQTHAIDVVAEPEPGARPGFRLLWPLARRNHDFPAFGAPLHAVADATVIRAGDTQRDHLSRTSLPALVYLMVLEAAGREMVGVRRIVGNYLVLDLGDGVYALYGHLRRGSLAVRAGDRVRAGDVLAHCGNSGNSSEPHVHFQLMDGPDPDIARGLPFTWRGIGVPRNGEVFDAPAPAPTTPA